MAGAHALHPGWPAHSSLNNDTTLDVVISEKQGDLWTGELTAPLALQIGDEVKVLDDGEVVDALAQAPKTPKTVVTQVNENGTFDIKEGSLGAQVQAGVKRDRLELVAATRTDIKGYTIKISGDTVEGMHLDALAVDFDHFFHLTEPTRLKNRFKVPETIGDGDDETRLFQAQIISTCQSRPPPPKTVFNIYSKQRQIGKNEVVAYLVKYLGAVTLSGTIYKADVQKITEAYTLNDDQAMTGDITPFQQQPILIIALAADDPRLQHPKLYSNLELLSDGVFLHDGKWDKSPWIFVIGNNELDPKKLSAGRLKCFHITSESNPTPFFLKANANFNKKVDEQKKDELAKSSIEDEVCETGRDREVIVFERVYCKGNGEGETLPVGEMVEELSYWDMYFKRFRAEGKSGGVRYKKTEFGVWMKTNFPAVVQSNPGNYPHYKGLKRKRP